MSIRLANHAMPLDDVELELPGWLATLFDGGLILGDGTRVLRVDWSIGRRRGAWGIGLRCDLGEWDFWASSRHVLCAVSTTGVVPVPTVCETEARQISLSLADGLLFWHIYRDPELWMRERGWHHGSIDLTNKLLGPPKTICETMATYNNVPIPMPEGSYMATVEIQKTTVIYKRSLGRIGRKVHWCGVVTLDPQPNGSPGFIPTSSPSDGIHGGHFPGRRLCEVVVAVTERALKARANHMGSITL